MYRLIFVAAFAMLPFSVMAEEAATSTVTVNVRYHDSIVFSAPVELSAGATALSAIQAADAASEDISITDLVYYSDFDSYYLNCIDIVSLSKHACDLWQYVVDSTYPSVGMDKYVVENGDVIYFFYGTPRRVILSAASTEASAPVTARTESYDYVNNLWTPLPGASLGATQPNPDDPYSPLVILSATTDGDGVAQIALNAPGTYNIGLAMDYYSIGEALSVIAASGGGGKAPSGKIEISETMATPEPVASATSTATSKATSTEATPDNATAPEVPAPETMVQEALVFGDPDKIIVTFEIAPESIAENYRLALEMQEIIRQDLAAMATVRAQSNFIASIAEETPEADETETASSPIPDQTAAVGASGDGASWMGKAWKKIFGN